MEGREIGKRLFNLSFSNGDTCTSLKKTTFETQTLADNICMKGNVVPDA